MCIFDRVRVYVIRDFRSVRFCFLSECYLSGVFFVVVCLN